MLWLSLRVAGVATALALALGPWLAWLLARGEFRGKRGLHAALSAALVLPPPVICYYFLCAAGKLPAFHWEGAALAGAIAAVPLLVWRARPAFAGIDPAFGKAARTLGASEGEVFLRVELPLGARAVAAAGAVVFLRVLAETLAALLIAQRFRP